MNIDVHKQGSGLWVATHGSNGAILGAGNNANQALVSMLCSVRADLKKRGLIDAADYLGSAVSCIPTDEIEVA